MPAVSPMRSYIERMHERFGYFATWFPNMPIRLGDIGFMDHGVFAHQTSLSALGIEFKTRPGHKNLNLQHTSNSGVAMAFKAAGEMSLPGTSLAQDKAGFSLNFTEEGAFAFCASRCKIEMIDDREKLRSELFRLHCMAQWKSRWVVIDEVVKAEAMTVVISNSTGMLDLEAGMEIKSLRDLANAKAGLNVAHQRGYITSILAIKGLTPLFKASRLRTSMFSDIALDPYRSDPSGGETPPAVVSVREQVLLDRTELMDYLD